MASIEKWMRWEVREKLLVLQLELWEAFNSFLDNKNSLLSARDVIEGLAKHAFIEGMLAERKERYANLMKAETRK